MAVQPMSDAIGLQLAQRRPDRFWAHGFARVDGRPQALARGALHTLRETAPARPRARRRRARCRRRCRCLAERKGFIHNASRFVRAKVPDGVEDPVKRHAEVALAALAAALQAFEQRSKFSVRASA